MKGVAIVGFGETEIGSDSGLSSINLQALAAREAILDAGLTGKDIDGVLTGGSILESYLEHSAFLCEHMGLFPKYNTVVANGSASHYQAVLSAKHAIEEGIAQNVVIVGGDPLASGTEGDGFSRALRALFGPNDPPHIEFELPFGADNDTIFALSAMKHMESYGTKVEAFAAIAATMRAHAAKNPKAHQKDALTIKDVLDSPITSTPLTELMSHTISDGGGAIVMTSLEKAKDLKHKPVQVLSGAAYHQHRHFTMMEDITATGAGVSAPIAFEKAGLKPGDVKLVYIHDPSSVVPLLVLEDAGFCKKGEASDFIGDGSRLGPGGELPLNTHGGLHSYCENGMGGIFHLIEATKQLSGRAEESRQVSGADCAFVHGIAGSLASHVSLLLSS